MVLNYILVGCPCCFNLFSYLSHGKRMTVPYTFYSLLAHFARWSDSRILSFDERKNFSMVPIILKSNKLGISTQNSGYYLLLITKSTFTAKYCPSELSSRQQNVGGNFHRLVYSKWEKMVEKLNEIFSLVIKCRWKFSSTFWVCWENVDEKFRRRWSSRCWISIEINLQHKTIPCQTKQFIFASLFWSMVKAEFFCPISRLSHRVQYGRVQVNDNLFQNTFKNENICLIQLKFSREG